MLCSALRRAAVGQGPCAKCSVRANSLILDTKPRSGTKRPLRTRVRKSRPGLLPTRTFAGLPNPTFSCQSAVSCPFSDDFSARSPSNRWRAENPPEKAQRILCADSEREGLLCADSAGEGLDDGRNPRLGWRGRKRAALLPARSETHRQSAPRRPGSSLPVRATIRCPPPPVFLPAGAIEGTSSSVTDPDPMGSGGGGVGINRLEKGCRPAIPHGSLPLSARRFGRVAGGRAFPGRAGPPSRRMRGKSAARSRFPSQPACTFPIAVVRTRHGPSPSGAPFSPPLAASPLLLARLFSLRTLSNPRFFLRMIDSGANGFNLCACTNRAKRRHETSCPMAG